MRHEILIIEDEPATRDVIRAGLTDIDAAVVEASSHEEALLALRTRPVSVVLADLGLPDSLGVRSLEEYRRLAPDVHIIVVTGSVGEDVRLRCFAAGVDDFVTKPFGVAELVARIQVGLRRRRSASEGVLAFGDLAIDLNSRSLRVSGREVDLTNLEFELLSFLALHPGRTFGHVDLLAAVWGSVPSYEHPGRIGDHVASIRRKIGAIAPGAAWFADDVDGVRFEPRPSTRARPAPLLAAVVEASGPVRLHVDSDGTVLDVSDAAVELFGALSPDELCGRNIADLVAEVSTEAMAERADRARDGDWPGPEDIFLRRLDGVPFAAEIVSRPVDRAGDSVAEISLWPVGTPASQVLQSVLTGISSEVADAVVITTPDLRVRSLNPAARALFGRSESDAAGSHLDELVPGIGSDTYRSALRDVLAHGAWTGVVEQPTAGGDVDPLHVTLTALRDHQGKVYSAVGVLRRGAPGPATDGDDLLDGIREALRDGRIVPHYQPIVRLHDGRILGYEVLARWQCEDGTVVPAARFMPQVERSDLIFELGRSILDQACRDADAWRRTHGDLHLAVNVSARQFMDPAFTDTIATCMARHDLRPGSLWLEVTESALVEDMGHAERALREIEAAGGRLSIDDFGTGWASLTYLRQFPVAGLKIDRSFVEHLGTGTHDEAIIRSILRLANELSLSVVAEGVETPYQRRALRALGCTLGQGYLFGRPAAQPALPGTVAPVA